MEYMKTSAGQFSWALQLQPLGAYRVLPRHAQCSLAATSPSGSPWSPT